jgi:DNA-binding IclR family transcriptional regulator
MSKTVAKAVVAMERLAGGPSTLTELAAVLDVHASTALRMLQPLVDAGFVARGADGRYRLGLRLAELGQQVLDELDLRTAARPHLLALAAARGGTVHLAQLVDDQIVYLDKIEGAATVRTWSRIGRPVPLHTAAVSKAILAGLAGDATEALIDRCDFARHTDATITSAAEFRAELARTAERGYATDLGEFEPLVKCVGVRIPDGSGRVAAAVSLTTVRPDLDRGQLDGLVPEVTATAAAVAAELGHRPSGGLSSGAAARSAPPACPRSPTGRS